MGRLAVAVAVALLVLAIVQLPSAKVDVYPEFTAPSVQIQTEALGLSAEEVEQLVTVPLEQDLLNGVPFLEDIQSQSMPGLSQIDLTFENGADLYTARQMVQERMTQAHALPNVGSPPLMIQPLASTSRVAMVSLSSRTVSLLDASILARWQIRPRLLGVPGVANVSIWGQRDRQLQVQVDPGKLNRKGVTLTNLLETAGNALWVSPLTFVEASTPGTGGFIETPTQRLAIQHTLPITAAPQLAKVPVTGTKLRLGDVATVVEDHQPLIGDALVNGRNAGLVMVVEKFPEANTVDVTRAVEKVMADMAPGLKGITVNTALYRPATYLERATHGLGVAGSMSLLLLVLVLGLFLWSWRAMLISVFSVVLSLAAATYVLFLLHATLTSMTVLGLALAVGAVIEDAVSTTTGLRIRALERRGATESAVSSTVAEAGRALSGPLVAATLICLLVVLPLLFLSPLVVPFTRAAAAAYALAMVISLLVSVTVTPALTVLLLGNHDRGRNSPVARRVQAGWEHLTAPWSSSRRLPLAATAVLALLGVALLPRVDVTPTLPQLHERNVLVQLTTLPGTSLAETERISDREATVLRNLPEVEAVGMHVGRAVTSDQAVDVNSAELWVSLKDGADELEAIEDVSRELRLYPGVRGQVVSYAQRSIDTASSRPKDVTVRLHGIDLQTMHSTAIGISSMMSRVPGVVTPTVEHRLSQPTVNIEVGLDAARRYGLAPGDVRRDATTLVSGLIVGSIYEQQKIFDVVVLGRAATRSSLAGIERLQIDTPSGRQVSLKDVATVRLESEPTAIQHNGVGRTLDVTADIANRRPDDVVADLRAQLSRMPMPLEYHAEVIGTAADEQALGRRVIVYALAALVGVFLLLQAATASWRRAGLLLVTVALSCVGGALSGMLTGVNGSVGFAAGLLAVLAIAVRSALHLVRRFQDLEGSSGRPLTEQAARSATGEHVLPVLLTASAVAAVFLPPLVLGGPGLEIVQPMAVTVLGGLLTYVGGTLVVLPSLYLAVTGQGRAGELAPADGPPTGGPSVKVTPPVSDEVPGNEEQR
jgi:Cu/Ag efflux pump CusA